jgi:hypothetical protein
MALNVYDMHIIILFINNKSGFQLFTNNEFSIKELFRYNLVNCDSFYI